MSRNAHRRPRRGKRTAVTGIVVVSVLATAGAAWAFVSATISSPTLDTGSITGNASATCQTGTSIAFAWPAPVWSDTTGDYSVTTLDYSNITAACVTLATADLQVNIALNGTTVSVANATAANMSATSGTLNLSTPMEFSDAQTSVVSFFVKNA
jgi:hypothetical protein